MTKNLTKMEVLEHLLNSMPGNVFVKDLEGRCLYMNHHMEMKLGICQQDWEGKLLSDFDLYEAEEAEKLHQDDQAFLKNEDKGSLPSSLSSLSKQQQTLQFCLRDNEGQTIGVCAISSNVLPDNNTWILGEEERTSEESKSTEDHSTLPKVDVFSEFESWNIFRNCQMAMALAEVITNEAGDPIDFLYLEVNAAFEQTFAINRSNIVGKLVTQVFPGIEKDEARWIERFGKVGLTGVSDNFVQYSDLLDSWSSGFIFRPNPTKRWFVVLFMEITKYIKAQEAVQESEERHRNLFESMMQGVVYQDASGKIIMANPAMERILGSSVEQMIGSLPTDPRWKFILEDGTDFPPHKHPSIEALQTGRPVTNVTLGLFSPQDKLHRWIEINSIPLFKPGEPDKPYQVYSTFTEITDKKLFEQEILRAKQKAEEADRLKSAFLANMSHEIRTPLNGIIGNIDLALANGLSPADHEENLEGLSNARASGELLISIIQDILDLSKIEAGEMAIQHDGVFSLQVLVDQTASIARTLLHSRRQHELVSFEAFIDPTIIQRGSLLLGDPFRIQQVVNNLVSNAVKFTNEGKVSFSVKLILPERRDEVISQRGLDGDLGTLTLNQPMLEYSVLDTGKGIPSSHTETIFHPFRQVDYSDTRQHGGTGLGLTITRRLVEMMSGHLRVESSTLGPIRGSCFSFTLPYRPASSSQTPSRCDNTLAALHMYEGLWQSKEYLPKAAQQDYVGPLDISRMTMATTAPEAAMMNETSNFSSFSISSNGENVRAATVATTVDSSVVVQPTTSSVNLSMTSSGNERTILVAEDDSVSRRLVNRMLKVTGYNVLLACDGEEAVCMYQSHWNTKNLVLILMDVQMPKLDGLDATKIIRQLEAENRGDCATIPIVALSAGAMKGDLERALAGGMTDYLTKPIDFKCLVKTLEHYLGKQPPQLHQNH